MKFRTLVLVVATFFTIALSACRRVDYTGAWIWKFEGNRYIYDLKMESYQVRAETDSGAVIGSYRGALLVDRDTLVFQQSEIYNDSLKLWLARQGPGVKVVYKVEGRRMILSDPKGKSDPWIWERP